MVSREKYTSLEAALTPQQTRRANANAKKLYVWIIFSFMEMPGEAYLEPRRTSAMKYFCEKN